MTFHGIYLQTPCQWPVWCMCEFHRNTKGKQSRRTHERISLCRENREGERKEDQSDSKIYFQAEHIGYKGLEGGMKRDIKVPKQTIIIIILLKLKRGMEERLTAIEWDRKAWSDGFMRRIMEGCPFFSSVEFAPMVRTLYIIHPEKGNWNQLIPDSDGNSDSSWQKDTVMDFYPAQAGRVPGSTCSLSCSSVSEFWGFCCAEEWRLCLVWQEYWSWNTS